MDSVKIDLKLFLTDDSEVDLKDAILVFHRWIQEQSLDELLIDVADYRHVPNGPGVILMAHDAQYGLDHAAGRLGLLYSRRRETHPSRSNIQTLEERLTSIFQCALTACRQLEAEAVWDSRLRFRTDVLELRLNDRLAAPDPAEAPETLRSALESVLSQLYPDAHIMVENTAGNSTRLTLTISVDQDPGVSTLWDRLAVVSV